MRLLKTTEEFRADTENEAKGIIEEHCQAAKDRGYIVKKCGYTKKEKKAKGEIIDEAWIVSISKEYSSIWED